MSRAIRPKPWETSGTTSTATGPMLSSSSSSFGNDSIPSSSINGSTTTKHLNNPHINRGGATASDSGLHITPSSSSSAQSTQAQSQVQAKSSILNQTPTQSSSSNAIVSIPEPYQTPVQPYSMYGSDYGMYGSSMYSPYNSMNSMYGGGYGSYGGYGGYGGVGMMGAPNWGMNFMQNSVDHVGRFSSLLQMASQALHMTFSSLVQFAGGLAMITREFGGFFSGVYLFRFLKYLWRKIRSIFYWILRQKPPVEEQMEDLYNASQNTNAQNRDKPSAVTMGFYAFGFLWLIQWIWSTVRREIRQQQQLQQQQQQQHMQSNHIAQPQYASQSMPMMPYGGGYGQYNSSPYNYMLSQPTYIPQTQIQAQPQYQTQPQTQTQSTDIKNNTTNTTATNNNATATV